MSKLTPELKERNKKAVSLRDKAYRDRSKDFRRQLDAAEASAPVKAARQAVNEANDEQERLLQKRNAELDAIHTQIAALTAKLKVVEESYHPVLDAQKAKRKAAHDNWRKLSDTAKLEVEAKFPDMVGVFSAGGWKNFNEFLPQVA